MVAEILCIALALSRIWTILRHLGEFWAIMKKLIGLLTRAYIERPRSRASALQQRHTFLSPVSPWSLLQTGTHLLMLRLFFFDPNSPCRNRMGDVRSGLSETGLAGSCRSYTRGTVVMAPEVLL